MPPSGTGRRLMQYVVDRQMTRGVLGIRLVQAAFHNRSLSLYTKLAGAHLPSIAY